MTEKPKDDKRAKALERIKALSSDRSTANRPGVEATSPGNAKAPKRAPKHGTVGHRPQGG